MRTRFKRMVALALVAATAATAATAPAAVPPPALHAVLNFYLHCDERDDGGFLENTDEIYLVGFYEHAGKRHLFRAGPHDFRDGGGEERSRDYLDLAHVDLKPGEAMTGEIVVMEDDGNFQAVMDKASEIGSAVLPLGEILKVFASFGKGEDDTIGSITFEIKNVDGTLQVKFEPVGQHVGFHPPVQEQPIVSPNRDRSGNVNLYSFRMMPPGANYHAVIWEGPPKS